MIYQSEPYFMYYYLPLPDFSEDIIFFFLPHIFPLHFGKNGWPRKGPQLVTVGFLTLTFNVRALQKLSYKFWCDAVYLSGSFDRTCT